MPKDCISSYLSRQRPISLNILFAIFYRLQVIELQNLYITYLQIEDAAELVLDTSKNIQKESDFIDAAKQEEILMYVGLIYESCLSTRISREGPAFCLKKTMKDQTEIKIVQNVILSLQERAQEEGEGEDFYFQAIQDLERQNQRFLGLTVKEEHQTSENSEYSSHSWYEKNALLPPPPFLPSTTALASQQYCGTSSLLSSLPTDIDEVEADYDFPLGTGTKGERSEKNEAMIKFLAHIRKAGMDLIFPQTMHDKLLVTLFVATKCAAPLAHRQLMDMILAARQAKVLGDDLDVVSKTKIRGILALLKNAHALLATGGSGEAVRLFLGKGVNTFREFREKHDSFLVRCILHQHSFLPVALKAEIIWQGDERSIFERLQILANVEPILEVYFVMGRTTSRKQQLVPNHTVLNNQYAGMSLNPRSDIMNRMMSMSIGPTIGSLNNSMIDRDAYNSAPTPYSMRVGNQNFPRNPPQYSSIMSTRTRDIDYGYGNTQSGNFMNQFSVPIAPIAPLTRASSDSNSVNTLSLNNAIGQYSSPLPLPSFSLQSTNTGSNNYISMPTDPGNNFTTGNRAFSTIEESSYSSYQK